MDDSVTSSHDKNRVHDKFTNPRDIVTKVHDTVTSLHDIQGPVR